jgi:predicted nucleic acid-binding protein
MLELIAVPTYDVAVEFTDGTGLRALFLDPPTIAALTTVAKNRGLSEDYAKMLAVADELKAESYTTEVKVANVVLATIEVNVGSALAAKRKVRKPRSDKGKPRKADAPAA